MVSIYQILKDLAALAWHHKRTALEVSLVAVLLFVGWRGDRARSRLEQEKREAEGLAAGLQQQITLKDGELEVLRRDSNGNTHRERVYVPPEGYVVISEKERSALQDKLNSLSQALKDAIARGDSRAADELRRRIDEAGSDTVIKVHDHGFVFRPGGRVDYANEHGLALGLDIKWYFWKRVGLVAGGTRNGIGPGISYHLDQLPYLHPRNLELFFNYNVILNSPQHPIAGGLRFDF